jgi:hypothetical protein
MWGCESCQRKRTTNHPFFFLWASEEKFPATRKVQEPQPAPNAVAFYAHIRPAIAGVVFRVGET